ncbi:hypothetical protein M404DRAFT_532111 [Pisolithus tinctorius Marx 270]|uniref:Uncharacterized protein n=1 Tax=Pisolithus tinctorius Marx 270 TaxID=870435 RepID=A0A0C3NVX2_PISTI|nr:hypothetical protein M404DRAFT_532111 [Pisolithus tinctorius Marx 270]
MTLSKGSRNGCSAVVIVKDGSKFKKHKPLLQTSKRLARLEEGDGIQCGSFYGCLGGWSRWLQLGKTIASTNTNCNPSPSPERPALMIRINILLS